MNHPNLYPNEFSGASPIDSFGMLMRERTYSSASYRFGFNGKEKSDEINGDGAVYDYGFRVYDARLARFLSVDPLYQSYPWYTPFQFAGNKPIMCIDLDGCEDQCVNVNSDATEPNSQSSGQNENNSANSNSTNTPSNNSGTTNPESSQSANNPTKSSALRDVTITITKVTIESKQAMKSYPENNGKKYSMPIYQVVISGVDAEGKTVSKMFYATRFGIGNNPEGINYGHGFNYKLALGVYGLADAQIIYPSYDKDYKLGSPDDPASADDGGFRLTIEGHFLHDGPDYLNDAYGSVGCIEFCNNNGDPNGSFEGIKNYIFSISGADNNADLEKTMEQLTLQKKIKVVFEQTSRPPLIEIK